MENAKEIKQKLTETEERLRKAEAALKKFSDGPRGKRLYSLLDKEFKLETGLDEEDRKEKNSLVEKEDMLEKTAYSAGKTVNALLTKLLDMDMTGNGFMSQH